MNFPLALAAAAATVLFAAAATANDDDFRDGDFVSDPSVDRRSHRDHLFSWGHFWW